MSVIKVNADYELALFQNKTAPQIFNQSLEFLAFFIDDRPVFSQKQYTEVYLNHIERVTGRRPKVLSKVQGALNWWGELRNLPLERELNSKVLTAEINENSFILTRLPSDLPPGKYLAKDPFSMSGQGFIPFQAGEEEKISSLLKKTGLVIVEPLLERVYDFSHYVISATKMIGYENLVDRSFQYRGTFLRSRELPGIQQFSFYDQIEQSEWDLFKEKLNSIKYLMKSKGVEGGFSVDSFIYRDQGKLKVRAVCEINYRKTMGLIAWELSQKYGGEWNLFLLGKGLKGKKSFQSVLETTSCLERCLYLSPGDTRFEMFLISSSSEREGKIVANELKKLLPDCEFSI